VWVNHFPKNYYCFLEIPRKCEECKKKEKKREKKDMKRNKYFFFTENRKSFGQQLFPYSFKTKQKYLKERHCFV
jgi:hypothetical protein